MEASPRSSLHGHRREQETHACYDRDGGARSSVQTGRCSHGASQIEKGDRKGRADESFCRSLEAGSLLVKLQVLVQKYLYSKVLLTDGLGRCDHRVIKFYLSGKKNEKRNNSWRGPHFFFHAQARRRNKPRDARSQRVSTGVPPTFVIRPSSSTSREPCRPCKVRRYAHDQRA